MGFITREHNGEALYLVPHNGCEGCELFKTKEGREAPTCLRPTLGSLDAYACGEYSTRGINRDWGAAIWVKRDRVPEFVHYLLEA